METFKSVFNYAWRFVVMALIALAAYWYIFLPWQVLASGDSGQAQVLDVWDMNTTVNDAQLLGLQLRVTPAGGGEAFEVKKYCRYVYPDEWLFTPGAQVEVRYTRLPLRVMLAETSCDQDSISFALIAVIVVGLNLSFWVMFPLFPGLVTLFHKPQPPPSVSAPAVDPVAPRGTSEPDLKVVENRRASPVERMLNLDELRQRRWISEAEYERLRAKILEEV